MDTGADRARWRMTAGYRLLPVLQVGVEFNPGEGEVAPLATWFLLGEEGWRPGVFLGTSSDRIGSPAGEQSYYLTAAKHVPRIHFAPYVTLNYSEWDERFNVPFGATLPLAGGFAVRSMYDGERSHAMLDYARGRGVVSVMAVWLERAGISFAVRL